jgi:hypothetical protein
MYSYGKKVQFTGGILATWIVPVNYLKKMLLAFVSIAICAFGATLYIVMDVVPHPQ